ncbi:class I SAM-dependent methyltransferase [Algiphilus sp. NNCM1]|nr:class I SAM-dependent methyltransferase [Algiphilus acroporae]MCI5043573.1 class I SAM-dependent methyltransferase [Aquisalinus sp.]
MDRITLINELFRKTTYERYLEIGCQNGHSFFPIRAKFKTAVDPYIQISPETRKYWFAEIPENRTAKFFEETSDHFFNTKHTYLQENGPLDVVLIDGLHTFRAALNDTLNSLQFLSDDGVIVMHDCLPPHAAAALNTNDFPTEGELINVAGWTGEWCGTVWKAIVYLRHAHPDLLDVFVIDTDYGLGIVRLKKKLQLNKLKIEEPLFSRIDNLSYEVLLRDARGLLGIEPSIHVHNLIEDLAIKSVVKKSRRGARDASMSIRLEAAEPRATDLPSNRLTVIVPSRTDAYLDNLLASLLGSSDFSEFDLVVADNGLSPTCRDRYPQAVFVETPDPFNFARAINSAVERSAPDADLLILNDDIEVLSHDFIQATRKALFLAKNYGFGAVSPVVTAGLVGNSDQMVVPDRPLAITLEPLCFVAVAIPRAVWNALGGLDESFPGYGCEDTDFCRRIAESGWMLGVTNLLEVSHGYGDFRFSSTFLERFSEHYHEMKIQAEEAFHRKWGPGPGLGARAVLSLDNPRRIPLDWLPSLSKAPGIWRLESTDDC